MAKIDLKEALREAYNAGFAASGEGYNGEYPFNNDLNQISRERSEAFHSWFDSHLLTLIEVE